LPFRSIRRFGPGLAIAPVRRIRETCPIPEKNPVEVIFGIALTITIETHSPVSSSSHVDPMDIDISDRPIRQGLTMR